MQIIDGQPVLSPTDLTKHLACRHITTLDLQVSRGAVAAPALESDELDLIFGLGSSTSTATGPVLRRRGARHDP